MNGSRQDAWTVSEDRVLADTVLRYIKEGGTQLHAFKDAGEQLKRTAAACGFRWNANIRKAYERQISEAKQIRKDAQLGAVLDLSEHTALDSAIMLLESLKKENCESEEMDYKLLYAKMKEDNIRLEQLMNEYEDIWKQMYTLLQKAQRAASEIFPNGAEQHN